LRGKFLTLFRIDDLTVAQTSNRTFGVQDDRRREYWPEKASAAYFVNARNA
jgi:hypothetical protein